MIKETTQKESDKIGQTWNQENTPQKPDLIVVKPLHRHHLEIKIAEAETTVPKTTTS